MNVEINCVKTADDYFSMPKEYQDLVIHQLRQHVEGELIGASDYLDIFYLLAPDAYEKKVCCERASEEIEHFMLGAEVLKDIGFDANYMLGKTYKTREHYKTEGVEKVDTWLKRGLFSFIGEAVVLAIILEMSESSYQPIALMTRQIIIDEYVHVAHGKRIVENYIALHGVKSAQKEFEIAWAMSLDLFGNSNSERSMQYLKWGLRKYSNGEARDKFVKYIKPQIEILGLTIPDEKSNRKFI